MAESAKYKSVISLNDLLIKANIGLTEEEREHRQDIKVSFKFYFNGLPKACFTDSINDTICYHKVASAIISLCSKNEFKLLEYLCLKIIDDIKAMLSDDINIWVKVEKCNPPVDGLIGGTSFEMSSL